MITFSSQITHVKAMNNDDIDTCIANGWDILGTSANAGDNPQFILAKQIPVQETNYHNSSLYREAQ